MYGCTGTINGIQIHGKRSPKARGNIQTVNSVRSWEKTNRYSEQLGRQFVTDRYGATWKGKRGNNTETANLRIVHLEKLWHYQQYGTIIFSTRSGKKSPFVCPLAFIREYEAFSEYCVRRDYAQDSRRTILYIIQKFLLFLDAQAVNTLKDVTASDIEGFCSIFIGCSTLHLKCVASKLSIFLRFLHLNGMVYEDKSGIIPKFKHVREAFLPSSTSREEINKLLETVDRCNSIGKRDYALLLCARRSKRGPKSAV